MDALAERLFDTNVGCSEDDGVMKNLLLKFGGPGTGGLTREDEEEEVEL